MKYCVTVSYNILKANLDVRFICIPVGQIFLKDFFPCSLEAKHLIWVWIMKVKGPKNQADFIEVLYVIDENYT